MGSCGRRSEWRTGRSFARTAKHPDLPEEFGWTYNHAPMLAYWNGKFYLEYLSNPLGEHVPPGRTLLMTSSDGRNWSKPTVVFPVYSLPAGNPAMMHQRMGFYVAPDGRLLALAFYGQAPVPFGKGGVGRVVREVHKDGTFGPVYFIRYNRHAGWDESNTTLPLYTASKDKGFVAACEALLANKLMTLQWWQEDQSPDDFYTVKGDLQALSFYHRLDGTTVALWKHSLAALSNDEGKSWTKPVKLPTVIMSGAKVWGQKTKDGRYAMVYNPVADSMRRYPLAIVTGADGIHFDDLLSIHGDIAPRRFAGRHKDFGVQYVRGIEEGNGTPPGDDLWVTYSSNKEDIFVTRVPVPVRYAVTGPVNDTFDAIPPGGSIPNWNIYTTLWAPVRIANFPSAANKSLELSDRDPHDYARAVRVFEESKTAALSFKVYPKQSDAGRLEIEVMDRFGSRPVRLMFASDGRIMAVDGSRLLALQSYKPDTWYRFDLTVDTQERQLRSFDRWAAHDAEGGAGGIGVIGRAALLPHRRVSQRPVAGDRSGSGLHGPARLGRTRARGHLLHRRRDGCSKGSAMSDKIEPSGETAWRNPVRTRLEAGEFVIGLTITISNIEAAAQTATSGFHFLWVEMEHSPVTLETLRGIVLAARGLPGMVFARVPVVELWTAKRVLDQGVSGVIFPFVSSGELAAKAAAACRYPPLGRRGSGAGLATFTWPEDGDYFDYCDSADRNVLTVAVIEQSEAVDHIDEIAATPGVDVLFIGTSDLSFSLGLRGRQDEPALEDAIAKIVAAGKRHGKFLGRPALSPEEVEKCRGQGFQFFQSVTELGLMRLGAEALLKPLGITPPPKQRGNY